MKIIMICGKARSGKDTLAEFIMKNTNNEKICRVQIGQYIKYYAMKYFGWNGEEETKPRDLLNHLGTDIIRNKINPDFHINRLIEDIEVLSYFYDTFIISDVRFPKVGDDFNLTTELNNPIKLLVDINKNAGRKITEEMIENTPISPYVNQGQGAM